MGRYCFLIATASVLLVVGLSFLIHVGAFSRFVLHLPSRTVGRFVTLLSVLVILVVVLSFLLIWILTPRRNRNYRFPLNRNRPAEWSFVRPLDGQRRSPPPPMYVQMLPQPATVSRIVSRRCTNRSHPTPQNRRYMKKAERRASEYEAMSFNIPLSGNYQPTNTDVERITGDQKLRNKYFFGEPSTSRAVRETQFNREINEPSTSRSSETNQQRNNGFFQSDSDAAPSSSSADVRFGAETPLFQSERECSSIEQGAQQKSPQRESCSSQDVQNLDKPIGNEESEDQRASESIFLYQTNDESLSDTQQFTVIRSRSLPSPNKSKRRIIPSKMSEQELREYLVSIFKGALIGQTAIWRLVEPLIRPQRGNIDENLQESHSNSLSNRIRQIFRILRTAAPQDGSPAICLFRPCPQHGSQLSVESLSASSTSSEAMFLPNLSPSRDSGSSETLQTSVSLGSTDHSTLMPVDRTEDIPRASTSSAVLSSVETASLGQWRSISNPEMPASTSGISALLPIKRKASAEAEGTASPQKKPKSSTTAKPTSEISTQETLETSVILIESENSDHSADDSPFV